MITVTYGSDTPVVGILFPNREPFLIWDKRELENLIQELINVNHKWNGKVQSAK